MASKGDHPLPTNIDFGEDAHIISQLLQGGESAKRVLQQLASTVSLRLSRQCFAHFARDAYSAHAIAFTLSTPINTS
jgi:hypothetical protein